MILKPPLKNKTRDTNVFCFEISIISTKNVPNTHTFPNASKNLQLLSTLIADPTHQRKSLTLNTSPTHQRKSKIKIISSFHQQPTNNGARLRRTTPFIAYGDE
jgi:hypothetical protein